MQRELEKLKEKSLEVLKNSQTRTGAFKASLSGTHYSACWLRDGFWIATALEDLDTDRSVKYYHWVLDLFRKHEWKMDKMIEMPERVSENEVLHPKFDPEGNEFQEPWGWNQLDSIGVVLYGISRLEKKGIQVIRDYKDRELLQKAVKYMRHAWKHHSEDHSVWEEEKEIHAASVAAMIAGIRGMEEVNIIKDNSPTEEMWEFLQTYRRIGKVYIDHGKKEYGVDLSTMVVWSLGLVETKEFLHTVRHIEKHLLGDRGGVKRYKNDEYFNVNGEEGQWTLGALWLSQFYASLYKQTNKTEHKNRALWYLWKMTKATTEEGLFPEQILAEGAEERNDVVELPGINRYGNAVTTPLAWSHAMYLLAMEELE